jgi:predicted acyl esterase
MATRVRRLALLLAAACVFLAPDSAVAQRSMAARTAVERADYFLQMRDGILLDCSRFSPSAAKPKKGWPVILYCHGYADSKEVELVAAADQAAFGYCTYAFSMRGQGQSGGRSRLISRTEMRDLMEVVDAIKRDTLVDPGRIAIYGSSQGGILPYMAACYGLDVRCILSDLASPIFASDWAANASPKMTLFFTVDYDSLTVRYDDEVKEIRRLILSKKPADRDSLLHLLPRDRDFLDRVDSCHVPLLITNAWQDEFFSSNGTIAGAERLRSKHIVYMGAIDGHGADSSGKENRFLSTLQNAWLEFWLNGIKHPLLDSLKYQYAATRLPRIGTRWSFSHFSSEVWPPEGIVPVRWYFRADSALSTDAPTLAESRRFEHIVRDSTLTMQACIDAQFRGVQFSARVPKQSLVFDSPPFESETMMAGIPRLRLVYASSAAIIQCNAQLWELRPNGQADFISRVNFSDFHVRPEAVNDTMVDGVAHAHVFTKGNRLRVVITNLDTQPEDRFLLSNPHVLPVLTPGTHTLFTSSTRPSYVELPLRALGPIAATNALPLPAGLRLEHIWPNPSHGQLSIRYSADAESLVRFMVTDLLGRSVAQWEETTQGDGAQYTELDGSGLVAGSYQLTVVAHTGTSTARILIHR